MELSQLINNATDLPKIPEVVQKLLDSFNSAESDADSIAEQLSQDQSLTAKVLRMANSSHFGGARKIGSVNDAVVFLGLNSLRTLVLASGIASSFKAPEHIDIKQFWRDSFAMAGACRWVCQFSQRELDRELAFTCGMMHNVGTILISILCPEDALEIHHLVSQGANREDLEQSRLGFTNVEAGAELSERWRFPTAMGDALRYQYNPADSESEYAAVLHLAHYVVAMNASENKESMMANFPSAIAEGIDIDLVAMLEDVDNACDDNFDDLFA
ncbi:HDOD domain-containing protein [Pseudoteredinibacter isoporae]|uniref:HD-like signal output (HDOD) protein n=1 Tax=Pseudoteredinibacter isoporae TaxID=570281 RepID=A0A7X0MWI3_9GAMM|nr:HDOD domain-containing protein [Pseudoteredinibacter isoporae]MBB6522751.1 HD-like signal output (HDOD) protein [Pseudoteredinibacter isoporae]NHO88280.1 HDOD domain-containing protein [Pseudoteredinibacter isoporae]NIB23389.1 HDOD domain-containing protein [Pseudoteredinibacter isoporae]